MEPLRNDARRAITGLAVLVVALLLIGLVATRDPAPVERDRCDERGLFEQPCGDDDAEARFAR